MKGFLYFIFSTLWAPIAVVRDFLFFKEEKDPNAKEARKQLFYWRAVGAVLGIASLILWTTLALTSKNLFAGWGGPLIVVPIIFVGNAIIRGICEAIGQFTISDAQSDEEEWTKQITTPQAVWRHILYGDSHPGYSEEEITRIEVYRASISTEREYKDRGRFTRGESLRPRVSLEDDPLISPPSQVVEDTNDTTALNEDDQKDPPSRTGIPEWKHFLYQTAAPNINSDWFKDLALTLAILGVCITAAFGLFGVSFLAVTGGFIMDGWLAQPSVAIGLLAFSVMVLNQIVFRFTKHSARTLAAQLFESALKGQEILTSWGVPEELEPFEDPEKLTKTESDELVNFELMSPVTLPTPLTESIPAPLTIPSYGSTAEIQTNNFQRPPHQEIDALLMCLKKITLFFSNKEWIKSLTHYKSTAITSQFFLTNGEPSATHPIMKDLKTLLALNKIHGLTRKRDCVINNRMRIREILTNIVPMRAQIGTQIDADFKPPLAAWNENGLILLSIILLIVATSTLFFIFTGVITLANAHFAMPLVIISSMGAWLSIKEVLNHSSTGPFGEWTAISGAVAIVTMSLMALAHDEAVYATSAIAFAVIASLAILASIYYRHKASLYISQSMIRKKTLANASITDKIATASITLIVLAILALYSDVGKIYSTALAVLAPIAIISLLASFYFKKNGSPTFASITSTITAIIGILAVLTALAWFSGNMRIATYSMALPTATTLLPIVIVSLLLVFYFGRKAHTYAAAEKSGDSLLKTAARGLRKNPPPYKNFTKFLEDLFLKGRYTYKITQWSLLLLKISLVIGCSVLAFVDIALLFDLPGLGAFSSLMQFSTNQIIQALGIGGLVEGTQWLTIFVVTTFAASVFIALMLLKNIFQTSPTKARDLTNGTAKFKTFCWQFFKLIFTLGPIVSLKLFGNFIAGADTHLLGTFIIATVVISSFSGNLNFKYWSSDPNSRMHKANKLFNQWVGIASLQPKWLVIREFVITLCAFTLPFAFSAAAGFVFDPTVLILTVGAGVTMLTRWAKMAVNASQDMSSVEISYDMDLDQDDLAPSGILAVQQTQQEHERDHAADLPAPNLYQSESKAGDKKRAFNLKKPEAPLVTSYGSTGFLYAKERIIPPSPPPAPTHAAETAQSPYRPHVRFADPPAALAEVAELTDSKAQTPA